MIILSVFTWTKVTDSNSFLCFRQRTAAKMRSNRVSPKFRNGSFAIFDDQPTIGDCILLATERGSSLPNEDTGCLIPGVKV